MNDNEGGSLWIVVLIILVVVTVSYTSNQMLSRPAANAETVHIALPVSPPTPPAQPPQPSPRRKQPDRGSEESQERPAPAPAPVPAPTAPPRPPPRPVSRFMLHTVDQLRNIGESPVAKDDVQYPFALLVNYMRQLTLARTNDKDLPKDARRLQLFRAWETLRQSDSEDKHTDFLWLARNDSDISNLWAKYMLNNDTVCQKTLDVVHTLENHLLTRFVTLSVNEFSKSSATDARALVSETITIFFQLTSLIILHDDKCCGLNERIGASWIESERLRNALAALLATLFCRLTDILATPSTLTAVAMLMRSNPEVITFLQHALERNSGRMREQDLVVGVELASRVFPPEPRALSRGELTRGSNQALVYIEIPEALVNATMYKQNRHTSVRNMWFAVAQDDNVSSVLYINGLFRPLPHFCNNKTWERLGVLSIYESLNATSFSTLDVDNRLHGFGYRFREAGMFEMCSPNVRVCNDSKLNGLSGSMTQQLFERPLTNEGKSTVSVISFISKHSEGEECLITSRADLTTETVNPNNYLKGNQRGGIIHHMFNVFQMRNVTGPENFKHIELRYIIHLYGKAVKMSEARQLASVAGKTEYADDQHSYLCFDIPISKNQLIVQLYLHNTTTNEKMFFELTTAANDAQPSHMPAHASNVQMRLAVSDKGGVSVRISHHRTLTKVSSCFICTNENSERAVNSMTSIRKFKYHSINSTNEVRYSGEDYDAVMNESCLSLKTNYVRRV